MTPPHSTIYKGIFGPEGVKHFSAEVFLGVIAPNRPPIEVSETLFGSFWGFQRNT